MSAAAVFAVIDKGLTLLPYLIGAGQEWWTIYERIRALTQAGRDGTATDAEVNSLEADIDAKLAEFNADV